MTVDRDDDLSREDLAELERRSFAEELHTTAFGRVSAVNADKSVDVRLLVRRALPNVEGGVTPEPMPILRAVRVGTIRFGGFVVRLPAAVGNFVFVAFLERDHVRAFRTGEVGDPIDRSTHHLAHAVCFPFDPRPVSGGSASKLVAGREDGPLVEIDATTIDLGGTLDLAIAQKVNAEFTKLVTTLASGTADLGTGVVTFGTPYVRADVNASIVRGA